MKLPAPVKTYIQQKCPQGITLFKNDKALYVKQAKMVNGKNTVLTKVVNMGLVQSMSEAEMKQQFEDTLTIAVNVKKQFKAQLANPNFTSFHTPKAVGVGTLGSVFEMGFLKMFGNNSDKQQESNKAFFEDLKEFFGYDKRLSDFTEEDIDGFKSWVAKKIAEREKNMRGTVSNNSINKRLGVLRSIFKFALKKRLLENEQLINPDKRVKNMGIEDLPRNASLRKPAFTEVEQEQFLQIIKKCGDQEWYDMFAWAFDTGMRHLGELDSFTIDNIDWGRKTITFWRPKTKKWSVEMPLTIRCQEIYKRRLKIAQARKDRKVFPSSASSRRHHWDKYITMCNFNKQFTPYTTRHTYCTRLAEAGTSPAVVMELAGHSVIETTMTYYTNASDKLLQEAINGLQNTRVEFKDETDDSMIGHNSRKALK